MFAGVGSKLGGVVLRGTGPPSSDPGRSPVPIGCFRPTPDLNSPLAGAPASAMPDLDGIGTKRGISRAASLRGALAAAAAAAAGPRLLQGSVAAAERAPAGAPTVDPALSPLDLDFSIV